MDLEVDSKLIKRHQLFYKWLQDMDQTTLIATIKKIYSAELAAHFIRKLFKNKSTIAFFMWDLDPGNQRRFANSTVESYNMEELMKVGWFFVELQKEMFIIAKKLDIDNENNKIKTTYVDIYMNLPNSKQKKVIEWYNRWLKRFN